MAFRPGGAVPRVTMIEERAEAAPDQLAVFDHIAASRGRMIRPFAAMLHRPELARVVADVGAVLRYRGLLADRERELVICTTAVERECDFEWDSHRPLALEAGVSEQTLQEIGSGAPVTDGGDSVVVQFVRELCRTGLVGDAAFEALEARVGTEGVVEVSVAVGYYTLLALFMNATEVC